ncbi:histidine phosphatase family protein [Candidatus Daviesbacteria bacterium]|nr:histidine phosphatase family protein [Candidatus Daviesbacteria bacterium]
MNNYCTLYIVRHGQTDWNLNGLTQGQTDIPLNETGIKQASEMAEKLKSIHFDAVFSSDLIRAKRTAEIITLEKNLAVQTTKLLRERLYGEQEGRNEKILDNLYETWKKLNKKEKEKYRPLKEFETDGELTTRFITFLREVAVGHSGKTVLVVTHGGIMRALLNRLSEETYYSGSISNLAYIKIETDSVDFFIKQLHGIKNV